MEIDFNNKEFIRQNIRKGSFVKKLYDTNTLTIDGDTFEFENLVNLVKCIQEVYENSWDFNYEVRQESINITGFIIHFPLVEISNKDLQSHIIRDLFVSIDLYVNDRDIRVTDIKGKRSTFTKQERISAYVHSHLRRDISNRYTSFCLGDFAYDLSNFNNCEPDEKEFCWYAILLGIQTLVSYESLEGGPYAYLNAIKNVNSQTQLKNYNESKEYLMNYLLRNFKNLSLSTKGIEFNYCGFYKCSITEDFLSNLKIHISNADTNVITLSNYFGVKKNGIIYRLNGINQEAGLDGIDDFYFKDELIKYKLIEEEVEEEYDLDSLEIADDIIDYLEYEFSLIINKKLNNV
jgi:hypothetical protein